MKTDFQMRVIDRFNFQGNRTVFVGIVTGHPEPIRQLICDLRVGEKIIGTITLEGEMLREERGNQSGLRSVSTLNIIPELPDGEIVLAEKCGQPMARTRSPSRIVK